MRALATSSAVAWGQPPGSWLQITSSTSGHLLRLAEEHAHEVISQCVVEATGDRRWPTRYAVTHIDLGLAYLQLNRIDEACHAGSVAFGSQRVSRSTIWRGAELDAALLPRFAALPEARDFHERYVLARRAQR